MRQHNDFINIVSNGSEPLLPHYKFQKMLICIAFSYLLALAASDSLHSVHPPSSSALKVFTSSKIQISPDSICLTLESLEDLVTVSTSLVEEVTVSAAQRRLLPGKSG